jgi:YD repeat-containing protein
MHGRVTRVADALGNIDLGYDAAGRVTTFREGVNTPISHTYDAAGRRITYRDSFNSTVNSVWDAAGRLAQLVYPSGHSVAYTYDVAGRLATVTDANGRLLKVERPNGTSRFGRTAKGLMSTLRELGVAGVVIVGVSLRCRRQLIDEVRTPAATVPLPTPVRMTYDGDNRVASYNGQPVVMDADGNLRRGPLAGGVFGDLSVNARNQLTTAGSISYTHDLQGLRVAVTSGGTTTRLTRPVGSVPRY